MTVVNDWRPWLVDGEIAGCVCKTLLKLRKFSVFQMRLTLQIDSSSSHSYSSSLFQADIPLNIQSMGTA